MRGPLFLFSLFLAIILEYVYCFGRVHITARTSPVLGSDRRPNKLPASSKSVTENELSSVYEKTPFLRAREISSVVLDVLFPLVQSLGTNGLPKDWEAFWSCRLESGKGPTNAERVSSALEELGPTYVKFAQALSTRPDVIPENLANALSKLQDRMRAFDNDTAKEIIRQELGKPERLSQDQLDSFLLSLSSEPVAAASIGQVYKASLPEYGAVAVKVQRPSIRSVVDRDTALLLSVAEWIESISIPGQNQLVAAKVVDAVDEFMSRIKEELDYRNEAANMERFANLYSYRSGSSNKVKVIVPEVIKHLCTDNVLVMEWIDGTKLVNLEEDGGEKDEIQLSENLDLLAIAIECTLSQLLDTGVLHADQHAGNLLKVYTEKNGVQLGYLDFGIVSTVPESVRDALVCAVTQLVFAGNVQAVAKLFGDLQLLPTEIIEDKDEQKALVQALNQSFHEVLEYPNSRDDDSTVIPKLRFDKLLASLSLLVTRFQFTLPPYFLNNARALATLEGIACSLDPSFSVLRVVYPFALNRLLSNPSNSEVVKENLLSLMRSPETHNFDRKRIIKLLDDSALLTGYPKRKVLFDVARSKGGIRVCVQVARGVISNYWRRKLRPSISKIRYFRL